MVHSSEWEKEKQRRVREALQKLGEFGLVRPFKKKWHGPRPGEPMPSIKGRAVKLTDHGFGKVSQLGLFQDRAVAEDQLRGWLARGVRFRHLVRPKELFCVCKVGGAYYTLAFAVKGRTVVIKTVYQSNPNQISFFKARRG